MKCSIIIVSWNTNQLLYDCLSSVYKNPPATEYEVIVVDNASSDDSPNMVRSQFPNAKLIVNEANHGFGRANNQAQDIASGDLLLLLNPDTVVHNGALTDSIEFMTREPNVGILGCRLLETDGQNQDSCGLFPTLPVLIFQQTACFLMRLGLPTLVKKMSKVSGVSLMPLRDLKSLWRFDQTQDVDWVCGAFMLLRRSALAGERIFDERFIMYGEDIDLCRRVRKNNFRIVYFATATITHHGGAASKDVPAHSDAAHYVGMVKFYQKHNGTVQAALYRLILFITAIAGITATARLIRLNRNPVTELRRQKFLFRLRVALRPQYGQFVRQKKA